MEVTVHVPPIISIDHFKVSLVAIPRLLDKVESLLSDVRLNRMATHTRCDPTQIMVIPNHSYSGREVGQMVYTMFILAQYDHERLWGMRNSCIEPKGCLVVKIIISGREVTEDKMEHDLIYYDLINAFIANGAIDHVQSILQNLGEEVDLQNSMPYEIIRDMSPHMYASFARTRPSDLTMNMDRFRSLVQAAEGFLPRLDELCDQLEAIYLKHFTQLLLISKDFDELQRLLESHHFTDGFDLYDNLVTQAQNMEKRLADNASRTALINEFNKVWRTFSAICPLL